MVLTRVILILLVGTLFCNQSIAQYRQNDSHFYENPMDIQPLIFNDSVPWSDPKKATVLAMVLPGAGQIYNKKYWKAGIVYAGAGALVYSFITSRDSMRRYQDILVNKIDGDSTTLDNFPLLSVAAVTQSRNFYRRNRDFTIVGFVALYALQIIDANVDAHLKEFEINEDLSMRIEPELNLNRASVSSFTGLTVRLTF